MGKCGESGVSVSVGCIIIKWSTALGIQRFRHATPKKARQVAWEDSEKAGISISATPPLGTYLAHPPPNTLVSLDSRRLLKGRCFLSFTRSALMQRK